MTARVSSAGSESFSGGAQALDERADALVMLGFGGHLVAAGHFADGHAVFRPVEFRHQIFEQLLDALARFAERTGNLSAESGSSVT